MVPLSAAIACMALLSQEVLVCQTKEGEPLICQAAPARCETPKHLWKSFGGDRKKYAVFINKLYGLDEGEKK
jgi:hypothetical protein